VVDRILTCLQVPVGCCQDQNVSCESLSKSTDTSIDKLADNYKLAGPPAQMHTLAWLIASEKLSKLKGMLRKAQMTHYSDLAIGSAVFIEESRPLF
jgi:hypothetical protein